jgi:hypothetical protein
MTKHSFWPNCNYSGLVFWSKLIDQFSFGQEWIYKESSNQESFNQESFNQESFNQESSNLENQLFYNNLIKKNPKTLVAWSKQIKIPISNTISKG